MFIFQYKSYTFILILYTFYIIVLISCNIFKKKFTSLYSYLVSCCACPVWTKCCRSYKNYRGQFLFLKNKIIIWFFKFTNAGYVSPSDQFQHPFTCLHVPLTILFGSLIVRCGLWWISTIKNEWKMKKNTQF